MKTKTRSKQAVKHSADVPRKNAAEEKLQAMLRRLQSHPSVAVGALIIIYCVVRLAFSS